MVQPAGKHLPFRPVQARHQPHRSDRGDGGEARHDPAGGGRGGGLRELPSLWTATGPGAGGTGKTSTSRRLDLAERPSDGWYFAMSSEVRDANDFLEDINKEHFS
jgi:hypothetical protein